MQPLHKAACLATLCLPAYSFAAVTGSISIDFDWDDVMLDGVSMFPTTYPEITGVDAGSWAYADTSPYDENTYYPFVLNDSYSASSVGAQVTSGGYYDAATGITAASAGINNPGLGTISGAAWADSALIFEAESTGTLTFAVSYSILADAMVGAPGESLSANYGVWLGAYDVAISDTETIADDFIVSSILECLTGTCTGNEAQSFALTVDVLAGETYALELYGEVYLDSYSTEVPLPTTAWLFASSLIGLAAVQRGKQIR